MTSAITKLPPRRNTEYLRQHAIRLIEMVHRGPRHDGIESQIGKRQFGSIAFAEDDVVNPGLGAALRRLLQHLRGEVERHYLPGGFCNRRTQDARTAGDVKHRSLDSFAQRRHETLR
jgi:hypothetical protein